MYCPECKAEYRPGFTTCSDCQVALVISLPVENSGAEIDPSELVDEASGDIRRVWQGSTEESAQEVRDTLATAKIPSIEGFYEPKLIRGVQGTIYWVAVRSRDFDRAQDALRADKPEDGDDKTGKLATDSVGRAAVRHNPLSLDQPVWSRQIERKRDEDGDSTEEGDTDDYPVTPADQAPDELPAESWPAEIQPEDNVAEIWSGDAGAYAAKFVQVCLRENSLAFRLRNDSGKLHIGVEASDAARAKEIVREIAEGSTAE